VKVGIIGGGVAGLAAAYRLLQGGCQVELLEAGPLLGGQVRTFTIGGGRIECFYHHIFSTDTAVARLIQELGMEEDLAWQDSRVGLFHGGRVYPFVTPLDLLRFSAISPLDRLRLGLMGLYLRRRRDWRPYEAITAKEWIIRHAGRRSYEVIWEPLLRGKFADRADDISMAWFWGKIHVRFASRRGILQREKLGYLLGSFGRYIDALTDRLRALGGVLHTDRSVEEIEVADGRAVGLRAGGELIPCDAVIATVPNGAFLKLAPTMPQDYASLLRRVQYQWATCLVVALKHPLTPAYWLNISDRSMPFVALVEQTNFVDPSHYDGLHVVYLSNYVDAASPILHKDEEELWQEYLPHIQRINPQFSPDWVVDKWLFKDPAGQPVITVGYSPPPHLTPIRGLYLANTTQIYPEDRGQNYSIRMGEEVARLLMRDRAAL